MKGSRLELFNRGNQVADSILKQIILSSVQEDKSFTFRNK
jgi:hypothetical protein